MANNTEFSSKETLTINLTETNESSQLAGHLQGTPDSFPGEILKNVAGIPVLVMATPDGKHHLFDRQPVINIGRRDSKKQVFPCLDLSQHGGYQRGVSRIHAQIIFKNGDFHIVDLNSSNGTKLNKHTIAPHMPVPIRKGDTIKLGKLSIRFQEIMQ